MWTSGSNNDDPEPPSKDHELIPRIILSVLFALGLVYFVLVVRTFSGYGRALKLHPTFNMGDRRGRRRDRYREMHGENPVSGGRGSGTAEAATGGADGAAGGNFGIQ